MISLAGGLLIHMETDDGQTKMINWICQSANNQGHKSISFWGWLLCLTLRYYSSKLKPEGNDSVDVRRPDHWYGTRPLLMDRACL